MEHRVTNRPQPEEPCWCGSGIYYRDCHLELDGIKGRDRVISARKIYSRQWKSNSGNLCSQGIYEWCAARLSAYTPIRLFDIGAGLGNGVLALYSHFHCDTLLSIDENSECLMEAHQLLSNAKVPVTVISRLGIIPETDRSYYITVKSGNLRPDNGVALIESDVLCDPELEQHLETLPRFDAVTVWFVGAHLVRTNCLNLAPYKMKNPGDYRLRVQNKAYDIADRILKVGGVLHIVDRSVMPASDSQRQNIIESHREQASTTTLEVQGLECTSYNELKIGSRVNMVKPSGQQSGRADLAVISILAIKR